MAPFAQAQPDFEKGKYCRTCIVCYQSGMELLSIQEKDTIAANKEKILLSTDLQTLQETVKDNRRALHKKDQDYKDLKETYENLLREKEEQEEQFQNRFLIFSKQMESAKQNIAKLKGKLLATALSATITKRKTKSDGRKTPWKPRLVTLSYAGLEYYKAEEPLGFIPISDIVCASPVAGGNPTPEGINANLSVSTRNGDVFDFELVGGEPQVNLWLDQIDLYTDAAANDGIGDEADSDFDDESDVAAVDSEDPFRMGWLLKQPGQTMGFWQRRFFVCAEGHLSYYKGEESEKPLAKFSLAGSDARRLAVPGRSDFCFQIFVPEKNRIFVVEAENRNDMDDWLQTLKAAVLRSERSPDRSLHVKRAAFSPGKLLNSHSSDDEYADE